MSAERRTYRPKRHLRHEAYSLALVLAAPLGVLAIFPFSSLSYRPDGTAAQETPARQKPLCSFVTLTDEQAEAAVQATRSAIKTAHEGISALRADLSISAIPVEYVGVANIGERQGVAPLADVPFRELPLPPSCAAPKPSRIIPDPASTAPILQFSRENLLEIND